MNLVELAQRLKARRMERRMTLDELATAAGQTRSWLSKVENFRLTPSLPALARLCQALGVPLADLVAGLDAKPNICVVLKEERQEVDRDRPVSSIIYESLAFRRPNRAMDPFVMTIPPGIARKEALAHEGEEFLMVLEGEIELEYDGRVHRLKEGDSAYFDASVKHRVLNPLAKPSRMVSVFHQFPETGR